MSDVYGDIGRNTLINLSGYLAPILVSLVTVPLYLDQIGQARYGVLALAWLLLGYFGVFDLGLGRAVANRIARLNDGPYDRRPDLLWTALTLNLLLGVVGGAFLFGAGHLFAGELLGLPADLRAETLAGLPWLAGAVPFLTVGLVLAGALEGCERFIAVNIVGLVATLAFQLAPLAVAYTVGSDLRWLLAAAAVAPFASTLLAFLLTLSVLGPLGSPRFDRESVPSLVRYGGWVTVTGVISPLLTILDRFVIGAISGARAVTHYTVPYNLVTRLIVLPMSLARTLFPRFSRLGQDEGRALGGDSLVGIAMVMTPLVVLALVLAEPFLRLWVGENFAGKSAPVAAVLLAGVWINTLNFVPYVFLQATGRPDLPAKFHAVELPFYVGGLWLALSAGGITGAATAWTVRVLFDGLLLGFASRLYRDRLVALGPPAVVVVLASAGALTIFDRTAWRISAGAVLVAAAAAWSWRARSAIAGAVPVQTGQVATTRLT